MTASSSSSLSRLSALGLTIAAAATPRARAQSPHWKASYRLDFSYDPTSPNGPQSWSDVDVSGSEWKDKYSGGDDDGLPHEVNVEENMCGSGSSRPSPIALIPTEEGCDDSSQIPTRPIDDGDCSPDDWDFVVTPLGLRAYPPPPEDDVCDVPQLRLQDRERHPQPWDLRYLEMHVRSEHVVDGRRFDGEMYMYHFGRREDAGSAVAVSVLIDASARRDDLPFEYMLQKWEEASEERASACRRRKLEAQTSGTTSDKEEESGAERNERKKRDRRARANTSSNSHWGEETRKLQDEDEDECVPKRDGTGCEPNGPRRLPFPYTLWPSIWYYSYYGSMTVPPCSDVVHWRVLDEPLRISKGQFRRLVQVSNSYIDDNCNKDNVMSSRGENFRPLQRRNQEAGEQEVRHCTSDDFRHTMYPPESQ